MILKRLLRISTMLLTLSMLLLAFAGCDRSAPTAPLTSGTPTPSESASPLPDGPQGGQPSDGQGNTDDGKPADSQPPESSHSGLYDPSIFVIEAAGTWRQELAPGYYADYECELYIDKVDSNDNRSASGAYTGVFWMKMTLDVGEFISDMLKDAPIDMDFAAGGEVFCDNLSMYLLDGYMRDPFENYDIPAAEGETLTPAQDALADNGSFIASAISVYLEAHAVGAQGETVDYEDNQTADEEMSYVIHVEPDPTGTATERKVTIYLTGSNGASLTMDGTWRRLPGYPEDVLEYASAGKQSEILGKHMQ